MHAFPHMEIPFTSTLMQVIGVQSRSWTNIIIMPEFPHMLLKRMQLFTYAHCLVRATSATIVFQACVPKKIIKEFTGHRSSNCVRRY